MVTIEIRPYSPIIRRSNVRVRGPSHSTINTLCQVPKCSRPFWTGSDRLRPKRPEVRCAWALLSTRSCWKPPAFASGPSISEASRSMSLTRPDSYSLTVSPQVVCGTLARQMPVPTLVCARVSSIRWVTLVMQIRLLVDTRRLLVCVFIEPPPSSYRVECLILPRIRVTGS